MSCVAEYSRLEEKVVQLLGARGTTAEKVKYLERMDRLWTDMTPQERAKLQERNGG